ncbi:hypothetical protein F8271_14260 [Micromonospora sp. ALFpr18c]|uniref:hypothetical protein n=1 Tax=unclassified Micromonospora TaxID=2617518 RepID=UPI00124BA891|nr:hypothetical protein [Micromonospora sp. ALFpr18c]KAB1941498.1 hypothetical protein F8271_14260 [Micromonospora sp. ALFpr18c]
MPLDAVSDGEPDDPLDDTGPLMTLAADPVIRGGRALKQNGHHEAGTDGGQDQHHPPGDPAHPIGHERDGSSRHRTRRGSIDGTSHAGTTPPLKFDDSS